MTKHLMKSAALAALLAMAAPAAAQDVTADTVVARVGDVEITMGHVLVVRQQLPAQYAQLPDEVLFQAIVDQLVDQYLFAQEIDEAALPSTLKLRLENDRRAIMASAVIREIADKEIGDEEVQEAYDAAFGAMPPETEYSAAHILVATEEEAQALITELEGGAEFAALAQEHSTDPGSGSRGGDLGWFGLGQMVPEFEQAVVSLEPGAVSEPVQTQFGWHIVRLNETREVEPPTIEEVRGEIEDQIRQERVEARIAELREAASPEYLTDQIDPAALRDDSLLAE